MTVSNYRVIDILKISTDYLEKKGIENPRLNVELLLAHVLQMNRVQLYLNFEKPLAADELDQFRHLLKRRAGHEPIQYILGETEFYSLRLKVNKYTLIPRPETEILVDKIIEICNKNFSQQEKISVLDIGTGSGNIAIALAKNVPRLMIWAIDIKEQTLEIAKGNAEFHHVAHQINFIKQDLFMNNWELSRQFDVIVSNPPYISQSEFKKLPKEIKEFEPYTALDGGTDGLVFYHRIAAIAEKLLRTNGFLAVEIGALQANQIKNLYLKNTRFSQVDIICDLNDLPRVLFAKK